MLRATELYAIACGSECKGDDRCHWCGGPCGRFWIHDDPPQIPFVVNRKTAKNPGGAFICVGDWLWRRRRITINFLGSRDYKDGQCPQNHSWWITDYGAWAIKPESYPDLLDLLVKPPTRFVLSMITDKNINHLQLANCNDLNEIKSDTPLAFTINNVPFSYTIYELKDAFKKIAHGKGWEQGKEPGVRSLLEYFGMDTVRKYANEEFKQGRGRPSADMENFPEKVIRMSGAEELAIA